MGNKIHIIGEGGVYSTLVYLVRQGIRPHTYMESVESLEDLIPYVTEKDTLMLLVRGLTDYTLQEVYSIIEKMEECVDKVERVIIMTNIPLGDIDTPYYLYSGDLVYGSVEYVDARGTKYPLDRAGEPIEEERKGFLGLGRREKEVGIRGNIIMRKMINKEAKHKPLVHARHKERRPNNKREEDFVQHIKFIDVYEEKNI